jgi:hypothetical protein
MKLNKLGKNKYRFEDEGVSLEGNLAFVVEHMREIYEIPQDEIDRALADLIRTGNDVAHFGVMHGGFLFTSLAVDDRSLLAELRAIQSVREEIVATHKRDGYRSQQVLLLMDRLEKLYLALNITGLINSIEGDKAERRLAA